jgi:hypothetical protein
MLMYNLEKIILVALTAMEGAGIAIGWTNEGSEFESR